MRQLQQADSPTSTEVQVTSPDGSRSTVVGHGIWPTWSPDGRWLAWSSTDPDRPGVVLLPVDTTGPDLTTDPAGTRLLPTPARAFAPAWAPDGSALAIWIADDGSDTRDRDLWHINVATGALRPLSQGVAQSVAAVRPSWHPLGTLLAFVAEEPGRPGAPTAWLVGADGSGQRRLLPDDGSSHHEWVQWAPHGLALALESNLNADGALIVTGQARSCTGWGRARWNG